MSADPSIPPSSADPSHADEAAGSADPYYAFRPSLLGSAWEFRLAPQALEWRVGSRSGQLRYERIARIRLSFRPLTMQSYRFQTEIWAPGTPRLQIASTSWKSMVEQQRLDAPYAAFVRALHARIADAGGRPELITGHAAPLYWAGVVVFAGTALGLAFLVMRALQEAAWAGAAFIAAFFGVFVWQLGTFLQRNRPGRYRLDALPPLLLPRS